MTIAVTKLCTRGCFLHKMYRILWGCNGSPNHAKEPFSKTVSPNQIKIQNGLVLLARGDTLDDTSQPCIWSWCHLSSLLFMVCVSVIVDCLDMCLYLKSCKSSILTWVTTEFLNSFMLPLYVHIQFWCWCKSNFTYLTAMVLNFVVHPFHVLM